MLGEWWSMVILLDWPLTEQHSDICDNISVVVSMLYVE